MSPARKAVLAALVVALLGAASAMAVHRAQDRAAEVRVEAVGERDLVAIITATGSVRARRQVNISSDVMGRVIELAVEEGDEVEEGQVLLRIDPSQIRSAVSRASAALSQAEAQVAQQRAALLQAERDLERIRQLRDRDPGLVSLQRLQDAETQVEVQISLLAAATHGVEQARAGLDEAQEQLGRTTIRAPISGRVTRLNIEQGETAVVGTMNNPGSLLLTISDLSVIEAVLTVDEIDLPRISVGDPATVELDAFPGERYAARVSRIASSALRSRSTGGPGAPSAAQQAAGGGAAEFEVVLTLLERPDLLRPDLSAIADIEVERRTGALAVPIIAVTILEGGDGDDEEERREGVFVVRGGAAEFRPVKLGLTGQEHFEVISGLSAGDSVVSGPFRRIRELRDGAPVRLLPSREGREAAGVPSSDPT